MNHVAAAIFQAVAQKFALFEFGILRYDQQNFRTLGHSNLHLQVLFGTYNGG